VSTAGRDPTGVAFFLLLAAAALFILVTSTALPQTVASHFNAAGTATGFMPRRLYVVITLLAAAGIPLVVAAGPWLALRKPGARLRLPHAEYWLTGERRSRTVAFVGRHMMRFAMLVTLFVCYVHGLVVAAHAASPPVLPSVWFIAGLAVFALAALLWALTFVNRFRLPARG